MMARLSWLAEAAAETGHPVTLVKGWQTRGSATFDPRGIVDHHTAGPATGDMPSLGIIVNGRADLPGPLANYGVGRSGRIYVVAAGRANHAGAGGWRGLSGNSSVLGVEPEHTGKASDPWPEAQVDAIHRLYAACAKRLGISADMICAHREWAPTRKIDPTGRPGSTTRAAVAALMKEPPMADDITVRDITARNIVAERLTVKRTAFEEGGTPGLSDDEKAAWNWAVKAGIVSANKNPDDLIRAAELVRFLGRYESQIVAPLVARVAALEKGIPWGATVKLTKP